jgi:hypothetical protein
MGVFPMAVLGCVVIVIGEVCCIAPAHAAPAASDERRAGHDRRFARLERLVLQWLPG